MSSEGNAITSLLNTSLLIGTSYSRNSLDRFDRNSSRRRSSISNVCRSAATSLTPRVVVKYSSDSMGSSLLPWICKKVSGSNLHRNLLNSSEQDGYLDVANLEVLRLELHNRCVNENSNYAALNQNLVFDDFGIVMSICRRRDDVNKLGQVSHTTSIIK